MINAAILRKSFELSICIFCFLSSLEHFSSLSEEFSVQSLYLSIFRGRF